MVSRDDPDSKRSMAQYAEMYLLRSYGGLRFHANAKHGYAFERFHKP